MDSMSKIGQRQTKNCKKCGRIFEYYGIGKMYCQPCIILDSEIFQRVKDYIYDHGPTNMQEISNNTGVSVNQIQTYLKEGRLEIPANSEIFIRCELCTTELSSGRYCPDCARKMSREFITSANFDSNEIGEERPVVKGKMRYLK